MTWPRERPRLLARNVQNSCDFRYSPSFAAALSLNNLPSRMYPRIDDADCERPCRMTENSGAPWPNASVEKPARRE